MSDIVVPSTSAVAQISLQDKVDRHEAIMKANLFERDIAIRTAWAATLGRLHHVQYGLPGIAKTMLVDLLVKHIEGLDGEAYFRYLMTRYTVPQEIFGLFSIEAMRRDEWKFNTDGKLPKAKFVFLDEGFNANSANLNTLLTIINERLFFNNGEDPHVPLSSLFIGTNNIPKSSDPELAAFWDRLTFRVEVKPMTDSDSWIGMFKNKLRSYINAGPLEQPISWDEIEQAQTEIATVTVPDKVLDKLVELMWKLKKEGIEPTPRRYNESLRVIQVAAWRRRATAASIRDMKDLASVLWMDAKDQNKVKDMIYTMAAPLDKEADDIMAMVEQFRVEVYETLNKSGTFDNEQQEKEFEKTRRDQGLEVNKRMVQAQEKMQKLRAKAQAEGRESEEIDKAEAALTGLAKEFLDKLFGINDVWQ